MFLEGYKYWLSHRTNNARYYRCSRYKTFCAGRCVVEDGKTRAINTHNHEPEPDKNQVEKFRKILTHRAATEQTDLYSIYWDEASQRFSDTAMVYPFVSAESAMRKARRKQLPQQPNSINELGNVLKESNLFHITSGNEKDPFYQTTLSLDGTTCTLFVHIKSLEQLGRIDEIHVDATVEVNAPSHYSLLTVHAIQTHISIPIVYAIMTVKCFSGYSAIFTYIREHLYAYIQPNAIICNYDSDMLTALSYAFPGSSIKGYWYNFTDSVLRYMKHLGMQRETSKQPGVNCLKMLLVLPLLPAEYITPGLEAIRKYAKEKKALTEPMTKLCMYIEQNWIRAFGVGKISLFGMPRFIYNNINNFNKDLRNQLDITNLTVWLMIETLTNIATKTFVKINRQTRTGISMKGKRKQETITDSYVIDATQLWIRTPVHLRNPLQFLQLTSQCIHDTLIQDWLNNHQSFKQFSNNISSNSNSSNYLCNNIGIYPTTTSTTTNVPQCSTYPSAHYTNQQQQFSIVQSQQQPMYDNTTGCTLNGSHLNQYQPIQIMQASNPPPLIFFKNVSPIVKVCAKKPSEPPPLVPISSNKLSRINSNTTKV